MQYDSVVNVLEEKLASFFYKGQTINIFRFNGYVVSVTTP